MVLQVLGVLKVLQGHRVQMETLMDPKAQWDHQDQKVYLE